MISKGSRFGVGSLIRDIGFDGLNSGKWSTCASFFHHRRQNNPYKTQIFYDHNDCESLLRKADHTAQDHFLSFQKGEERGFNYFFHLHYKPLLRYAITIAKDLELAEDVVGDCFVKLWEKRETIIAAQGLKSFLYTSVRNTSLDALRRKKSSNNYVVNMRHVGGLVEPDASHKIVATESIHQVRNALQNLSPSHRRVIEMVFIEEKKLREVADEMKLPLSTVKSQKAKALQILKKQLPGLGVVLWMIR